jgi:hypothetical protein
MLVAGIPFPVTSLKVEGSLQRKLTIRIRDYDKDKKALVVMAESVVPASEPRPGKASKYFTQAANVTWEFTKAGITFETVEGPFVAEKEGATIVFTDNGVEMNGVVKARSGQETGANECSVCWSLICESSLCRAPAHSMKCLDATYLSPWRAICSGTLELIDLGHVACSSRRKRRAAYSNRYIFARAVASALEASVRRIFRAFS